VKRDDRSSRSPNDFPTLPFAELDATRAGVIPEGPLASAQRTAHATGERASVTVRRRHDSQRLEQQLGLPFAGLASDHVGPDLKPGGYGTVRNAQLRRLTIPVTVLGPASTLQGSNSLSLTDPDATGDEASGSHPPSWTDAHDGQHRHSSAGTQIDTSSPTFFAFPGAEGHHEPSPVLPGRHTARRGARPPLRVISGRGGKLPASLTSAIQREPAGVGEEVIRRYREQAEQHRGALTNRYNDQIEEAHLAALLLEARIEFYRTLFE
jgi:hypothetical protein